MQVHDSLTEIMGNTPLIRLRSVTRGVARHDGGAPADVLAKVEYLSPGGSVKDRIALRMVEAAERSGALRPDGVIVEPTSGNTGVGLAIVAQERGYRCVFTCPDKVAQDKISVLRACRPSTRSRTTAPPVAWSRRRPAAGSRTSTRIRRTRPRIITRPARRSGSRPPGG
jgi:cystathionine beta-synthase